MARVYLFADEAGNFDFSRGLGATRYWTLGSISLSDPAVGEELLRLRRLLAWRRLSLDTTFHASEDPQIVRDAVFDVIRRTEFRLDVTVFDKHKTIDFLRESSERFYKQAWFLHMKYVCPRIVSKNDEMMVVAASIGTKNQRKAVRLGIEDVVHQVSPSTTWRVAFWPSESDPCLQIADYCVWAIQRKYEMGDLRSYQIIKPKLASEFEAFGSGVDRY